MCFVSQARYKYLLHLEGFSASSRMGQLLHTNSLVLRAKESRVIEYYYRSLRLVGSRMSALCSFLCNSLPSRSSGHLQAGRQAGRQASADQ
jgi:hypothetical protein